MANARAIVKRRKSVRNIRKITRTMQLIATARLQAAINRVTASKPYAEKLAELVGVLSRASGGQVSHPLLRQPEKLDRVSMVVITSERGLCGGYNAGVLRVCLDKLRRLQENGVSVDAHVRGKKGVSYFKFLGRSVHERITGIGDTPRFEQVEPLANRLMERFSSGSVGAVFVAYMRFLSMSQQRPFVAQLLPLAAHSPEEEEARDLGVSPESAPPEFEYSPGPAEILGEVLPASVRVRLFQCFNEAVVSEHMARMVAMKAATDAAGEMITTLTREYNRARQTQITLELLDIVGGVNALS